MSELLVGLGARSYPIIVKKGLLNHVGEDLRSRSIANRFAIITDDQVASLYGDILLGSLKDQGIQCELIRFAAGEASKNLQTIADLAGQLASLGFDRKDAIIGFGGGVAGDMAGFLAASYMRGIPFVQIPTTLLAQVDSSVGGKTGVDIPEGKNLVGAFYQPQAVYIDSNVLDSLPREELLGGLAEVIKYGVIRDDSFFDYLNENREAILSLETDVVEKMILTCCRIKAEVVSEDEREGGLRRILNYGHTIGHAVEAASDFTIIHGFGVAIGMVAAARIAEDLGFLAAIDRERIVDLLNSYGLPLNVPRELDRTRIKRYLKTDKKSIGGKVFYVLPTTIGKTSITAEVEESHVDQVLEAE